MCLVKVLTINQPKFPTVTNSSPLKARLFNLKLAPRGYKTERMYCLFVRGYERFCL
jgi:hypothetical protein